MAGHHQFTVLLFTLFLAGILAPVLAAPELKMVVAMTRHGSRSPHMNILDVTWPAFTELSPSGIRQLYILGSELRRRYIDELKFLPPTYDYKSMYVVSTNKNRTLMSATSALLGMYPLGTGPKLNEVQSSRAFPRMKMSKEYKVDDDFALPLGYQPIPVITMDTADDPILAASEICPRARDLRKLQQQSQTYKDFMKEFAPILSEMATLAKQEINATDIATYFKVYDSMLANLHEMRGGPIAADSPLWGNLSLFNDFYYSFYQFGNTEALKLYASPFFADIFDRIDKKLTSLPNPDNRWITYSAHDGNIWTLLGALNITRWDCLWSHRYNVTGRNSECSPSPNYASLVLLEIYRDEALKKNFIQLRFNDRNYSVCGGKADDLCDYDAFAAKFKKEFHVPEWQKVCSVRLPGNEEETGRNVVIPEGGPKGVNIGMILLWILGSISVVLAIIYLYVRRRLTNLNLLLNSKEALVRP